MPENNNVCWAVPFKFNKGGRVNSIGGKYDIAPTSVQIEEAVITGIGQIVYTTPGERLMNGNYGLALDQFAFRPVGSTSFGKLQIDIEEQVALWEGRAIVLNAVLVQDPRPSASNVTVHLNLEYSDLEGSNFTVNFGM